MCTRACQHPRQYLNVRTCLKRVGFCVLWFSTYPPPPLFFLSFYLHIALQTSTEKYLRPVTVWWGFVKSNNLLDLTATLMLLLQTETAWINSERCHSSLCLSLALFLTNMGPILKIKFESHIACLFTAVCGRSCTVQLLFTHMEACTSAAGDAEPSAVNLGTLPRKGWWWPAWRSASRPWYC